MKIVIPNIEISEDNGFTPEYDIFNRQEFGERLANLIANSGGNPVIALDSNWGEGKSTFIKMWRGYIKNKRDKKLISIYFDAFENDYQKDPFLALAAEIYKLISTEDEARKEKFQSAAIKAMKSIARGSLKLAVKVATSGIIDDKVVDSVQKDISTLVSDQVDDIFKQKFEHAEEDKESLRIFRGYLSSFADEMGGGNPIVFIVDELDRCRPDFALELLEHIKHLFSVSGITFLLVTNRAQLEGTIKSRYGHDVDASNYLHKFLNVWLSMPRVATEHLDFGCVYLRHVLKSMMDDGTNTVNQDAIAVLESIVQFYQPSFREIERVLSYFAVLINMLGNTKCSFYYQCAVALVSYLKACNPGGIQLNNGRLDKDSFFTAIDYESLSKQNKAALSQLCYLIEYEFAHEDGRNSMIEEGKIRQDSWGNYPDDAIHKVNNWLNGIAIK
ncbi:P-loop NTPase fold protein [Plesiomonas shigelloides]|uniref:KAP family P-loop NTPase fold protein n=1 Tax=Plesiomonas shigelloides TaxID=703 RepID=UPI0012616EBE|nr:P-loop NTPase fold protein [Plesiomonas shigelloides]KAB7672714.1 hypothetical protein GBN18_00305 [Plesiomonas shigelloides]